jgi:hypothetical protein
VSRVPIDKVIDAAGNPEARAALFPVQANPAKGVGPVTQPMYPAAGRPEPPAATAPGAKTDDGKKPEEKKPEDKKGEAKTEGKK